MDVPTEQLVRWAAIAVLAALGLVALNVVGGWLLSLLDEAGSTLTPGLTTRRYRLTFFETPEEREWREREFSHLFPPKKPPPASPSEETAEE